MMGKKLVVITETIHEDGYRVIGRSDDIEVVRIEGSNSPAVLDEVIKRADAVMVRVTKINREMILAARSLKIISKHGVGYDNIDVGAATERRIPVTFTPGTNSHSVAEHVVGLMLAISKKLCSAHMALKTGTLTRKEDYTGVELWRKTVGIVGLGRIGREVARKCSRGFDMTILVFDPFVDEDWAGENGFHITDDLDELLKNSDFLSINCPLTPETRNLIGDRELSVMKETAFIMNTSRGGIVDELALHLALEEGRIAGAGLDVFVDEPPKPDHPLMGAQNVVATPHTGGVTEEAMSRMAVMGAEDILRALSGERPIHLVNPQLYE